MSKINSYTFKPIAFFKSEKRHPIDAAQQGSLDPHSMGSIELSQFPQWQQMLDGLSGFSHLWIIFVFHNHSQKWKPKVWPPRSEIKVGVLASRSPYRPNPIGMSAVRLIQINGSQLIIGAHDLLDGTPILDLKPYLTYSDSWPEAKLGWVENCHEYTISYSNVAKIQLQFLSDMGIHLQPTIEQQLRFCPTEKNKKRVNRLTTSSSSSSLSSSLNSSSIATSTSSSSSTAIAAATTESSELPDQKQIWILSIRTWRVRWNLSKNFIQIESVYSGYSAIELSNQVDPFSDKESHRALAIFSNNLSSKKAF